jgi:hypothetical protein
LSVITAGGDFRNCKNPNPTAVILRILNTKFSNYVLLSGYHDTKFITKIRSLVVGWSMGWVGSGRGRCVGRPVGRSKDALYSRVQWIDTI